MIGVLNVLKVLICLCAAVYMHVRFAQGAGVLEVDIPSEYFRSSMSVFSDGMHESYGFVLCLLGFECLVLVLGFVYRRFLKGRFRFAEKVCTAAMLCRFIADVVCIVFVLFAFMGVVLLTSGRKSFELMDGDGNSTMLVSELKN